MKDWRIFNSSVALFGAKIFTSLSCLSPLALFNGVELAARSFFSDGQLRASSASVLRGYNHSDTLIHAFSILLLALIYTGKIGKW